MDKNNLHGFCVETPVGVITIVFEEKPFLLRNILLPAKGKNAPVDSVYKDPSESKGRSDKIKEISQLILDGLNGKMIYPPWDIMFMEGFTVLQKAVYRQTAKISYGFLSTYKKIAEGIGRPGAYRFVGTTLAKNPYPLLIPCHRVIRSDNKIGGFGGGSTLKQRLIQHEAADSLL
ncbi:MAG: methylated-DNA--[protein]-cysteine S-methyltransferase [Dissulfuribacterales bacterium]